MSGPRLVALVVVPFLLLVAVGYWLTQREEAPVALPEAPAVEARAPSPSMPKPAPRLTPPGQEAPRAPELIEVRRGGAPPSKTPVTDALTQALVEARPSPPAAPPPPPASPEEPKGTLNKEDIRAAIHAVTPLIAQCFHDAEERYPGPQKVTLSFTIQGQGLTGYFKDGEVAESTIQDPWMQACFLEALTDARFPPPKGGGTVRVTYPFKFQPDSDGGR